MHGQWQQCGWMVGRSVLVGKLSVSAVRYQITDTRCSPTVPSEWSALSLAGRQERLFFFVMN